VEAEELNNFLDYVKDIQGYLLALTINFHGLDEKVAPYQEFLSKVGTEDVDPVDFYECLTEMYSVLGIIQTAYPETGSEILPCIKVVDHLRNMFRCNQSQ